MSNSSNLVGSFSKPQAQGKRRMSNDANLVAASTDYQSWDPSAIFGGGESAVSSQQDDDASRKARDKAEEMLRIAQADAESEIQALRLQMEQDEEEARRVQSDLDSYDALSHHPLKGEGKSQENNREVDENDKDEAYRTEVQRLDKLRQEQEEKALEDMANEKKIYEKAQKKSEEDAAAAAAAEKALIEAEEKRMETVRQQVSEAAEENARLLVESRGLEDVQLKEEEDEKERLVAEEHARRLAAEEKARLLAVKQAHLEAEELARFQTEEKIRLEAKVEAKEEQARLQAEENTRILAEEEQARLVAEEEQARLAAAEEHARLQAEENTRIAAEEEQARFVTEEEQARLQAAEEHARLQAEENTRIAAEKEQARLVAEEEQARLQAAEEEQARLQAEENTRIAAEEEQARLAAEKEQARLAAEEEQARFQAAEEHARLQAEENTRIAAEKEQARLVAEEEQARLAAEEETRIAAEEEQARMQVEEKTRLEAEEEQARWPEVKEEMEQKLVPGNGIQYTDGGRSQDVEVARAERESGAISIQKIFRGQAGRRKAAAAQLKIEREKLKQRDAENKLKPLLKNDASPPKGIHHSDSELEACNEIGSSDVNDFGVTMFKATRKKIPAKTVLTVSSATHSDSDSDEEADSSSVSFRKASSTPTKMNTSGNFDFDADDISRRMEQFRIDEEAESNDKVNIVANKDVEDILEEEDDALEEEGDGGDKDGEGKEKDEEEEEEEEEEEQEEEEEDQEEEDQEEEDQEEEEEEEEEEELADKLDKAYAAENLVPDKELLKSQGEGKLHLSELETIDNMFSKAETFFEDVNDDDMSRYNSCIDDYLEEHPLLQENGDFVEDSLEENDEILQSENNFHGDDVSGSYRGDDEQFASPSEEWKPLNFEIKTDVSEGRMHMYSNINILQDMADEEDYVPTPRKAKKGSHSTVLNTHSHPKSKPSIHDLRELENNTPGSNFSGQRMSRPSPPSANASLRFEGLSTRRKLFDGKCDENVPGNITVDEDCDDEEDNIGDLLRNAIKDDDVIQPGGQDYDDDEDDIGDLLRNAINDDEAIPLGCRDRNERSNVPSVQLRTPRHHPQPQIFDDQLSFREPNSGREKENRQQQKVLQARRHHAAIALQKVFRGHQARCQAGKRKEKMKCRVSCPNCGMLEQVGVYCKRCGRKMAHARHRKQSIVSNPTPLQEKQSQSKLNKLNADNVRRKDDLSADSESQYSDSYLQNYDPTTETKLSNARKNKKKKQPSALIDLPLPTPAQPVSTNRNNNNRPHLKIRSPPVGKLSPRPDEKEDVEELSHFGVPYSSPKSKNPTLMSPQKKGNISKNIKNARYPSHEEPLLKPSKRIPPGNKHRNEQSHAKGTGASGQVYGRGKKASIGKNKEVASVELNTIEEPAPVSSPIKPPQIVAMPGVPLLPCQMQFAQASDQERDPQMKYLNEGYLKMFKPKANKKKKLENSEVIENSNLQQASSSKVLPVISDGSLNLKKGQRKPTRIESTMSAPSRDKPGFLPPPVRVSHDYGAKDDSVLIEPILTRKKQAGSAANNKRATPSRLPVRSSRK